MYTLYMFKYMFMHSTWSSTRTGSIPKKGLMGKPGLGVWSLGEGLGAMAIPPVSVDS